MPRITVELLRKRVEHNEGEIHSVEELALHQEKLEKIENLDKWCKNLKILLLQNNLISKIENVGRLKQLEYLNLALNNIERIENLEGCESLTKLDLTLNFIGEISSVWNLRQNYFLESLYLTGNPCTDFPGYRKYIIQALPQLKTLDGEDVTTTERLVARQDIQDLEEDIMACEKAYLVQRQMDLEKYNRDHGDDLEVITTDNDEYWNKVTANTPETRKELSLQAMKLEEKSKEAKGSMESKSKSSKPMDLFFPDGRPKNINQPKLSFTLQDDYKHNQLILDLSVPRFMDTSLIQVDLEPTHVKVVIKGKIFQMVLSDEVKPDSSNAHRSKTTGHLVLTMPKAKEKLSKIEKSETLEPRTDYVVTPADKDNENTAKMKNMHIQGQPLKKIDSDWRKILPASKESPCVSSQPISPTVENKPNEIEAQAKSEKVFTSRKTSPIKGLELKRRPSKSKKNQTPGFIDNPDVWPLV